MDFLLSVSLLDSIDRLLEFSLSSLMMLSRSAIESALVGLRRFDVFYRLIPKLVLVKLLPLTPIFYLYFAPAVLIIIFSSVIHPLLIFGFTIVLRILS